ncbi:MAG TPA: DUF1292 domain-containing protein [Candidatus Atribacteria bacterium]|nr:DUF1292 domain-containing protein [Candidatus Atribacteria bacterium]HPT79018.1 DUF1292 domain-containing protein [Candidatus Atribacteria bacterium]
MDEYMYETVELLDENNNPVTFRYVMSLTLDNRESEYIVLSTLENEKQDDTEDELVILRVEQDENGDDVYVSIEDEEELNEVFEAVTELYDELYPGS